MSKLGRSEIRAMILEERRRVTRALIAEGGCGCGGCSTCKASLVGMAAESDEHEHPEESGDIVITYDDDGLPHPKHYMDHASASAYDHSYPYEKDTGDDIVHGHGFSQSYMAKQHLHSIVRDSQYLSSVVGGDEELEDWCESKLAVAASMVQAVKNYVHYHKTAAGHPEMESVKPLHPMHTLSRILDEY